LAVGNNEEMLDATWPFSPGHTLKDRFSHYIFVLFLFLDLIESTIWYGAISTNNQKKNKSMKQKQAALILGEKGKR
jgi:hypothetical protein